MGHRRQALQGKVAVSKPLFGQSRLTIAGRDKSNLVDGLAKLVELVEAAMIEIAPDVATHGALCFVNADLAMLGKISFKGVPLVYPKSLAKRIHAPDHLTPRNWPPSPANSRSASRPHRDEL